MCGLRPTVKVLWLARKRFSAGQNPDDVSEQIIYANGTVVNTNFKLPGRLVQELPW